MWVFLPKIETYPDEEDKTLMSKRNFLLWLGGTLSFSGIVYSILSWAIGKYSTEERKVFQKVVSYTREHVFSQAAQEILQDVDVKLWSTLYEKLFNLENQWIFFPVIQRIRMDGWPLWTVELGVQNIIHEYIHAVDVRLFSMIDREAFTEAYNTLSGEIIDDIEEIIEEVYSKQFFFNSLFNFDHERIAYLGADLLYLDEIPENIVEVYAPIIKESLLRDNEERYATRVQLEEYWKKEVLSLGEESVLRTCERDEDINKHFTCWKDY